MTTATPPGDGGKSTSPHPATVSTGRGWRGALETWRELRGHAGVGRLKLSALVGFGFLAGLFETVILLIVGRMAVAIAAGDERFELEAADVSLDLTVGAGVALGVGFLASRLVVLVAGLRISTLAGTTLVLSIRRQLLRSYFGATHPAQSEETASRVVQLVGGHSGALGRGVAVAVSGFVSFLTLLMLVGVAFVIEPVAAGLMTAMLVGLSLILLPVVRASRRAAREAATDGVALTSQLVEATSLALEIRTFAQEDGAIGEVDTIAVRLSKSAFAVSFRQSLVPQLFTLAGLLILLAGLGGVSALGVEDVGGVGAVVLVLLRAVTFALPVQAAYQQLLTTEPFLDGIRATIARLEADQERRGGESSRGHSAIRFRDVSFAYRTGPPVLEHFDLDIPSRGSLGLVGPSGGGKTTAIGLVLSVLSPTGGRVEVVGADGVARDLSTLDPQEWRSSIAFVPQLPRLSSGSVADNIRFHREIPQDRIVDAARRAHVHEAIVALPEGYDTLVGELGSNLSGGQRQRISLARALAGDPDLIVLDEPTSSLDAAAEQAIVESLRSVRGEVGLIIVAHRLTTLQVCDRIAVVDGGSVADVGSHDELLERNAFYRNAIELGVVSG